ncbi:hypothetical protein [Brevibacillus laterosporus]|uniref:Uncharacterized protein n=1 Tax=Brevibacillus laterosporus TaxID=1465 RepID=A0AAP3DJS5_BRELA|nr:hypothetical protein [Brevibacillus laterosporus]MCR8982628.1 hypothetical protein [Brevibacillus laterosporus]MCZ0809784.1 hypothetical protein [Brevibacillus laterosporus]MCZ0828382.1 hypothetical protein [Brevibacillus laterosporus]MCZ0852392.1 hypothetical protein [Brevibacillus laterosporus]
MDKPIAQHVTFYRAEGRYNILDSSEVSAQYIFRLPPDAPNKLSRSFLIDIDKDYTYSNDDMTALELAEWIQSVFDSYWIHTSKKQVAELVEYLRSIEGQEEIKRAEYNLEYAKYQVWEWTNKLNEYQGVFDKLTAEESKL